MKEKFKKYLPYIIIIAVSIIICIPLFSMNLSDYNEYRIHIGRVASIKQVITDDNIQPLISYKHMNGFGYALNVFYGPITTYIPIIISFAVVSASFAIKIFTFLTVLISGLAMYKFVKHSTKNNIISIISALIYMCAPYKLTDIYSRNAVGEYTAFIFIPILFDGLYRLLNGEDKDKKLLIIGIVVLILSHTITTIYTAIFAIVYIAINYKKFFEKEKIKRAAISILISLLLCLFYVAPLLEYKLFTNYTIFDQDRMNTYGTDVYEQSLDFKGFFENELSKNDELITSLGCISIALTLITIICYKRVKKEYKQDYNVYLIFSLISLFMSSKLFPWFIMPKFLTVIQFGWRMLGFYIFFDAIICGINVYTLMGMIKKEKIKNILLIIVISATILLAVLRTDNYFGTYNSNVDKNFENTIYNSERISPYQINRDYMPLKAINNISYLKERDNRTYILDGEADIIEENKEKLNDIIKIDNVENATIELPFLYYPGYEVTLNGKQINTFESDNGFIALNVKESGTIEIKYKGTILEKIAYKVSETTLILLCIYLVIKKIRNKSIEQMVKKNKTEL